MQNKKILYLLTASALWVATPVPGSAGGLTPDMTALSPGMMGIADQGDATVMGERMGKFMGSFMREMKNAPDRVDTNEGWRGGQPAEALRQPDRDNRSGRGEEPREVLRYVPLYDPWGADRGNPYLEPGVWGGPYGSPHYQGRSPGWNEPGPYGWAADQNWNRGRGYYGAGLDPWESQEPPPDPYTERRWHDPSYYNRQEPPAGYGPHTWEDPHAPRAYAPWSNNGTRRGNWW
ncbi:MAG: hypothetical protein HQL99_05020 [Magnetococcales bacterium]|nr:hypothetical protein [Magnetococcales bacterium]